MVGIEPGQCRGNRVRHGVHGSGRVPQMWVGRGGGVGQRGDVEHDAVRGWIGFEQAVHPRVVAGAVDDHQARGGERARGGGIGLEEVGVLGGVGQDAAHGGAGAGDVLGHGAVDALGGDDGDGGLGLGG